MIQLLLVDDHPIVRRGIRQLLAEYEDIVVSGEAGDAREALQMLRGGVYSLALVDISLPGRSGIDLLDDINSEFPDLPVLILSTYPEDQYARRVLQAGASGYLTKDAPPEVLVAAIRKVAEGGRYISPNLADDIARGVARGPVFGPNCLSNREFEVLRLLGRGLTPTDIAGELKISVKTVSTYRTRMMEKLGLDSTAALIRYAVDNKITD